jgi:serine/threonine protein kinase
MITQEEPGALIGQQLGSYRIDSILGAGSMGVVYKAPDTRLNRTVAVKILPPDRLGILDYDDTGNLVSIEVLDSVRVQEPRTVTLATQG